VATALTEYKRERRKLNGVIRCGDKREDSIDLEQLQERTQRMLCWDRVNYVVKGPPLGLNPKFPMGNIKSMFFFL
jgi:hypothetical protein